MVFWEIVVYFITIRKRKGGFTKMKNKFTALVAAMLLSISMLHTEVYASTNPDSNNPLAVSENAKLEFYAKSKELQQTGTSVSRSGALIHPANPDAGKWSH